MPDPTNPTYEALLARRSANARALVEPGPDAQTIAALGRAVAHAPDHGQLVPFRLLDIPANTRPRLAYLLAEASLALNPALPAIEVERSREKAFQGPVILALIGRIDNAHPKIPASDQWLTLGCALENLLLAAQSFGFSAAVRSGRFLETAPMRSGFALGENEHLVALVAIGSQKDWSPAKPKPALEQVLGTWQG